MKTTPEIRALPKWMCEELAEATEVSERIQNVIGEHFKNGDVPVPRFVIAMIIVAVAHARVSEMPLSAMLVVINAMWSVEPTYTISDAMPNSKGGEA